MKIVNSILVALLILCSANHCNAQFDYGDAPDPAYPTLISSNGAAHMFSPLFMGNYFDADMNGLPGPTCSGDDNNQSIDDEDGVMFTTWILPGQNANVIVSSSFTGMIDAWIDFNTNGSWLDPGEKIINSQPVNAGQNTITFSVPVGAMDSMVTYGRFRLSTVGGLFPTGVALDGEVEDYQIWLGPPLVTDVSMDPDAGLTFTQNEISMTYEPSLGHIVAAYNDEPFPGGPGIGVSYSSDDGQTWLAQQLSIPNNPYTGGPFLDAFDPSIAVDDAGNVFVAQISTDYNWSLGPASGLFVHKSSDGGATWSAPVTVDTQPNGIASPDPNFRFNDRCQIRCDVNPSSPNYNNVYVAWIQDRGWNMPMPMSDIYFSYSTDGGNNFSIANQINLMTNDLGNMPVPAVASNGDVYVLWVNYNVITGGNGILLLNKSTDGGVNWGTESIVDTIPLPPIYLNGGTDVRAKGAAVLRTHPTNSNILYIVYAADPDGTGLDESDIFFTKSMDGGINWLPAIRVNDDATATDQVLPWMEVKPNGIIDFVWYDRRLDGGDILWDVYSTTSTDEGVTFSTNARINSNNSISPQTIAGPWFGEYLGLAVHDSMAYVGYTGVWSDVKGDIFFTGFNNPILGNAELMQFDKIKLFPNPIEDYVTIECSGAFTVNLFDIKGNLLATYQGIDKYVIETSILKAGIYILQIQNDQGRTSKKLIKL